MTNAHFEFVADTENNSMTVRRLFAAPRQLVWDCYTKPELLDRWYAPKPLTAKTKTMDFRPGGHWHFAMITPDGQEYWSRLDYQTISPIDGYTGLDGFSDADGGLVEGMPQSQQEVSFLDEGQHTRVVSQVQYGSREALQQVIDMGVEAGIASTLDRLDALLAELA